MKGRSGDLYVIGDIMLRHLYQIYDFEDETISLGVNKHSEGEIRMFKAHGMEPDQYYGTD
jgi:ribosomal protein S18 acetylase RimI-like enzyme